MLTLESNDESAKEEALVDKPENGAVAGTLAFGAACDACAKRCCHLYVTGFAVQPDGRRQIENCERTVPATWGEHGSGDERQEPAVEQVFSVCGLPGAKIERMAERDCRVELLGLDAFNSAKIGSDRREGADVPAWFLDIDGLRFRACQAFFPETLAWEGLKRSPRGEFGESVRSRLSRTVSGREHSQVAVEAVDDRGNELMFAKPLSEPETGR